MNSEALIRTAEAIAKRSVPDLGFNMSTFCTKMPETVNDGFKKLARPYLEAVDVDGLECSTICCGAGWAVTVHDLRQQVARGGDIELKAEDILGLNGDEAYDLFYRHPESVKTLREVTRDMCVNTYLYAAEHGKVDWDAAQEHPPKRPWETPPA